MAITAYYSPVIARCVAEKKCCTFRHTLLFRCKAELLSNVMKTKDTLMYISFMGDNTPRINMTRNNAPVSDVSR